MPGNSRKVLQKVIIVYDIVSHIYSSEAHSELCQALTFFRKKSFISDVRQDSE